MANRVREPELRWGHKSLDQIGVEGPEGLRSRVSGVKFRGQDRAREAYSS